jgi:BirA family transcriptional regulator, biotin operon repressor / biotin---[acetyl-CoA-carboxylase] ligase
MLRRNVIESELARRTLRLGLPLTLLDVTQSTNDEAKRAAKEGAPHGSTWIAEEQTHGRGRQGRSWLGVRGESLMVSILLRVPNASRLQTVPIAVGIALRDALAEASGTPNIGIKWPNDILLEGKKLAGILVESTGDSLIVGFGINVHAKTFSGELEHTATSLALITPESLSRDLLLIRILERLDSDLPTALGLGLAPMMHRLQAHDILREKKITRADGTTGTAQGIDEDGRLRVLESDGIVRAWSSGEVHLINPHAKKHI